VSNRTTITATAADDGRTLHVPLGAALDVHLRENASTGFRWEIDNAAERILTPTSARSAAPAASGASAAGAASTRTFTFRASAPGQARLRLKLWRPWEGDLSIAKRFAITVVVTPKKERQEDS
jgi:inhibitor of cysteine peptidase